jgi:signal transduction histidine kinase
MSEPNGGHKGHPQRQQTDESLRVERDKADASVADKRDSVEDSADEVVRVARQRADQVVQTARDDADRERRPESSATGAISDGERARADDVLELERSDADAVLAHERAERKRYLADFLAVEREATDKDLVGERAHADTVIAARDEFLATVSHDLRSLLGGLSLSAGLLGQQAPQGEGGDAVRKHAAMTERLVARMNRLISDLLDIASIEAGRLAVLRERLDVGKIVSETLEAFAPIAAAKRIVLEGNSEGSAVTEHAELDGGRILQVLANLVSNAIKFTPSGGRVSIRVRRERSEIVFAVSDTGIGIAESGLESVFERFRQIKSDRRGLGLGLHISKCIVAAHGGRMWVDSELGRGSTFYFAVPAAVEQAS